MIGDPPVELGQVWRLKGWAGARKCSRSITVVGVIYPQVKVGDFSKGKVSMMPEPIKAVCAYLYPHKARSKREVHREVKVETLRRSYELVSGGQMRVFPS